MHLSSCSMPHSYEWAVSTVVVDFPEGLGALWLHVVVGCRPDWKPSHTASSDGVWPAGGPPARGFSACVVPPACHTWGTGWSETGKREHRINATQLSIRSLQRAVDISVLKALRWKQIIHLKMSPDFVHHFECYHLLSKSHINGLVQDCSNSIANAAGVTVVLHWAIDMQSLKATETRNKTYLTQ